MWPFSRKPKTEQPASAVISPEAWENLSADVAGIKKLLAAHERTATEDRERQADINGNLGSSIANLGSALASLGERVNAASNVGERIAVLESDIRKCERVIEAAALEIQRLKQVVVSAHDRIDAASHSAQADQPGPQEAPPTAPIPTVPAETSPAPNGADTSAEAS